MFARYRDGHIQGVLTALDTGNVLACDVKCRSMGWCCYNGGQTAFNSHAAVEANDFKSDLTLVVVHGDHAVKLGSIDKDGIGRERTFDVNGGICRCGMRDGQLNTGADAVDFFAAKDAVLAVVRVQGADTNAGALNAVVRSVGSQSNCFTRPMI
jgi:hypothetical protein